MELKKRFAELYGNKGCVRMYRSPGRVNLIGEHTDYNGGYVFPCALDIGTYGAARKRDDGVIRLASANFDTRVELSTDDIAFSAEHGWANYLKGVVKEFQALNTAEISGFDLLISGNIPNGAGLSSSASIELLMCAVLKDLFGYDISMIDMVKLSQRAENTFMGVNCGIMDQFVVGMGKKDHALFLKCDTLDYEYVPLDLAGCKLVIANTNKKRGLTDSKYNERRSECERAVELLNRGMNINCLGELSVEEFTKNRDLITDEICLKRAEHVVREDGRVTESVKKLKEGDIEGFGKLMNESHESLRDLYEVTGYELDTLVELAWKQKGVLGSRMTGAGFGGCTVSIVEEDAVENFVRNVTEQYRVKTGLEAEIYLTGTGDGAMRTE